MPANITTGQTEEDGHLLPVGPLSADVRVGLPDRPDTEGTAMNDAVATGPSAEPLPDPVAELAAAVVRHVETDGVVPVLPEQEDAVVRGLDGGSPRSAAAALFLAHDEAANGDRAAADRLVLRAARAIAGGDPDLTIIASFYTD